MRQLAEDALTRMFESKDEEDYIVFAPVGSQTPFVQFAKTFRNGQVEIFCNFPIAKWSKEYQPELERLIHDNGHEFESNEVSHNKDYNIYLGTDLKTASQFFYDLWTKAFGLSPDMEIHNIGNENTASPEDVMRSNKLVIRLFIIFPILFMTVVIVLFAKFGMLEL